MSVESVVFLSLVLDLFAFTIPLPLFPRLIEWYLKRESSDANAFLSRTLTTVASIRRLVYDPLEDNRRWDVVLLGGMMGSVFSTLQFIVSPIIGSLSDKHGRKKILLWTMVGNVASALVWIQSTTFASFLLARAIGGLSEGNVQLAIAILSDVSTPKTRAKTLSLVGIAFAICFCIGPPIGAYFSTRPLPPSLALTRGIELNIYATPALITLVLLLLETLFLAIALPETRGKKPKTVKEKETDAGPREEKAPAEDRVSKLKYLQRLHLYFLGIFSGVEFTLTFLTYDLFDWSNAKNGRLLGFIGIASALLQGGYVRRAIPKVGEATMSRRGISACALGLVFLAILPHMQKNSATLIIHAAAMCLAFTSATVVNSLTSWASLQCDEPIDENTGKPLEQHPQLVKGRALGEFRSAGQLGRAIGPILACASYWTVGPSLTYAVAALAMVILVFNMKSRK